MKPWLVLITLPMLPAAQREHSEIPELKLLVYDLAGMRKPDLSEALAQTTRVFQIAAVELSWTAGDPVAPEAHLMDFSVPAGPLAAPPRVIVARITNKRIPPFPPGTLGWALPAGAHVTIFLDEIKRRQAEVGVSVPYLLAYALAHELGHVLMRSGAHAPRGLMRAEWGRAEFDRIQHGALRFNESEAAAMRTSLLGH
jgi:hypothetical protein